MVIQLAPSDCSIAHFPAVAAKIAVPVPEDVMGTTFVDALIMALAEMFLRYRIRPVQLEAVGNVTTTWAGEKVAPEKIKDESVEATV